MRDVEVVPSFMGTVDVVLQASDSAFRTPAEVFGEIFWAFIAIGTVVGIVVIGYTLYNSYKYREGEGAGVDADVSRPQLGELPEGSGGGKKLALSFSISAVIVVGLIIWTYSTLLYVEDPPDAEESMEIDVIGSQFSWQFEYPNGERTSTLHAPTDRIVWLNVTSVDVFHNFGIAGLRAKTDAIPGQMSRTWFYAEESGDYTAICYELCGAGHSGMTAPVVVHEESAFESWYATLGDDDGSANATASDGSTNATTSADSTNATALSGAGSAVGATGDASPSFAAIAAGDQP